MVKKFSILLYLRLPSICYSFCYFCFSFPACATHASYSFNIFHAHFSTFKSYVSHRCRRHHDDAVLCTCRLSDATFHVGIYSNFHVPCARRIAVIHSVLFYLVKNKQKIHFYRISFFFKLLNNLQQFAGRIPCCDAFDRCDTIAASRMALWS